jgi:hypothetical protein
VIVRKRGGEKTLDAAGAGLQCRIGHLIGRTDQAVDLVSGVCQGLAGHRGTGRRADLARRQRGVEQNGTGRP